MFLLKMMRKYKNKIKKNTKSQLKEILCEIVNFGSTKLTKPKKKKILETQQNGTTFHNTFIVLLYFIFTSKELTVQ